MFECDIPGFGKLHFSYLLLDFNGTLAVDGKLIQGVDVRLQKLTKQLQIHVITGDSFGTAKNELANIDCKVTILPSENQGLAKKEYLHQLNPQKTIAIGNGRNDQFMLKDCALGILVLGKEGTAIESLIGAKLITSDIHNALDLLIIPKRLIASLRS